MKIFGLKEEIRYLTMWDSGATLDVTPSMRVMKMAFRDLKSLRLFRPCWPMSCSSLSNAYWFLLHIFDTSLKCFFFDCLKVLVALACDLELDTLPCCAETHKWAWFRRYCMASRVAVALDKRTPLPRLFLDEVLQEYFTWLMEHVKVSHVKKMQWVWVILCQLW